MKFVEAGSSQSQLYRGSRSRRELHLILFSHEQIVIRGFRRIVLDNGLDDKRGLVLESFRDGVYIPSDIVELVDNNAHYRFRETDYALRVRYGSSSRLMYLHFDIPREIPVLREPLSKHP